MTDPELIEAVKAAVVEAMNSEARRALPTHQALTAEWRLMVRYPSGPVLPYDHATEAEALEHAERLTHSTWTVERRLVGAWTPVPRPAPLPAGDDAEAEHEGRD